MKTEWLSRTEEVWKLKEVCGWLNKYMERRGKEQRKVKEEEERLKEE